VILTRAYGLFVLIVLTSPFGNLSLPINGALNTMGRMGGFAAIGPKSEIRMSKSETMTEIRISNDQNPLFQVKCFEFGTFEI